MPLFEEKLNTKRFRTWSQIHFSNPKNPDESAEEILYKNTGKMCNVYIVAK